MKMVYKVLWRNMTPLVVNCQRPVFSLGVSQHAQNNKPVNISTKLVVEVAR